MWIRKSFNIASTLNRGKYLVLGKPSHSIESASTGHTGTNPQSLSLINHHPRRRKHTVSFSACRHSAASPKQGRVCAGPAAAARRTATTRTRTGPPSLSHRAWPWRRTSPGAACSWPTARAAPCARWRSRTAPSRRWWEERETPW